MKLSGTAKEIAEIIGRQEALYLIGQLPRCAPASRNAERVIMYVPTVSRLRPDHQLVKVLGLKKAEKLCRHFGGEILDPGTCRGIYRKFRDENISRMVVQDGIPKKMVAEWFSVTGRHVNNLLAEKPQEYAGR